MELEFAGEISTPSHQRRQICDNCNRPTPVCLCHVIPSSPIPTSTQIIVIQHPHESQHKLNTAHLLTKSLLNAATIIARRLTPNLLHPIFAGDKPPPPMFYLFPHTPSSAAVPLSELKAQKGRLVLIVFDATWKHAKEMVKASEGLLSKLATRVCLDGFDKEVEGESIYESELVLRKEPWGGCVSTMEAVARWLGAVEEGGAAVEETLLGVLREAVKLQAQFLKPMKPRPKLLKKNKRHQCVAT